MHHAVGAVGQATEGDRRSLHVREETFESAAVVGVNPPREVDIEARVVPRSHALHGLGANLLSAEHEPEEALAEDGFQAREVDVFHGQVDPVGTKEAE